MTWVLFSVNEPAPQERVMSVSRGVRKQYVLQKVPQIRLRRIVIYLESVYDQ